METNRMKRRETEWKREEVEEEDEEKGWGGEKWRKNNNEWNTE